MIELVRIIEDQTGLYSYRATQDEVRALQLEQLIEMTKPSDLYATWHPLIATPFRYAPPHPEARFRPLYGKNVFYGALIEETALYEHAFHFMKERMHLKVDTDTGSRTIFSVSANEKEAMQIKQHDDCASIMNKNNYAASHQFVKTHPTIAFILYPSCRDPQQRENAAVLDITYLEKNPLWESNIKFFYNNQLKQITWIDYDLHIKWEEVS